MDEQQALLGRTVRPSLVTPISEIPSRPMPDYSSALYGEGGSSSDGSDSWWEDSHSSCSSCTRSDSSEEDWEPQVSENGELLFVEPLRVDEKTSITPDSGKMDSGGQGASLPPNKLLNMKDGKFVRWIRRRESKRQRPRLSLLSEQNSASTVRSGTTFVTVDLQRKFDGTVEVASLGLQLGTENDGSLVVRNILPNGPLSGKNHVSVGDCLKSFNGEDISSHTLEKRLSELSTPCQIVMGFQKRKETTNIHGATHSKLLKQLLEGDSEIGPKIVKAAAAVMVLNLSDSRDDVADGDLLFAYPPQSCLIAARGALLTLNHLVPPLIDSECQSCTCQIKDEDVHLAFIKEDDLLLLLALPERICRLEETLFIAEDISRCLQFTHQTLLRKDAIIHKKFFSSIFSRLFDSASLEISDMPLEAMEPIRHHFHQFLPSVSWIPLPREAQLQLDDALNELESCDFGHGGEDAVESERRYIVLGSCIYHQGYLLASHLTKEDLLDVHSFLRQNGLLQINRTEGVARLILWKEVYPHSVNRGLPPTGPTAYPPPVGRWFLLVVSTGQDILAVLLESAGCCLPLPQIPRPHVPHIREAEDTLAHIQSLGLTSLAAQWLAFRARPRTTALAPSFIKSSKDKAWIALQRSAGDIRILQEDCSSQTTSNPSNTSNASESDENAPILGRRAERSGISTATLIPTREPSDDSHSDISDSDSDWGSFKGLNVNDNGSSLFDNPYLPSNVGDLEDITPSKVTTGSENLLYHFVHIDGNEGIMVTPGGEETPPSNLMAKFTDAAHNIHSQLQHNVRFRTSSNPRGVIHKSLVAVKECGVLVNADDDGRCHWVVGRLFFTPKPREIYVCYSDDAPQNMLELSFRFGLNVAG